MDHEPTYEQLSAVAQLALADAVPYVDFSLFGPHGVRMLKKLMFTAQAFCPQTGNLQMVQLPGPPDLATWLQACS